MYFVRNYFERNTLFDTINRMIQLCFNSLLHKLEGNNLSQLLFSAFWLRSILSMKVKNYVEIRKKIIKLIEFNFIGLSQRIENHT